MAIWVRGTVLLEAVAIIAITIGAIVVITIIAIIAMTRISVPAWVAITAMSLGRARGSSNVHPFAWKPSCDLWW